MLVLLFSPLTMMILYIYNCSYRMLFYYNLLTTMHKGILLITFCLHMSRSCRVLSANVGSLCYSYCYCAATSTILAPR
ncbi:hypothetical protein BDP27DRAFT_1334518 [Rhodocollybia butyracea]|uniref:Uncharacterized protein n=1 Tax=Rhodocollybia butyracea TaxID=206335 RepID=A0A9P5PH86_9AGAR|nr:hypothetical protein BDP27DRAFT_1334518 [Rhodocollybia butyracea]